MARARTLPPGSRAPLRLLAPPIPDPIPLGEDDLIVHAPAAELLGRLPERAFDLIYIDPPFNTGRVRNLQPLRTIRDEEGTRGFGGRRYRREPAAAPRSYSDSTEDYLGFLGPLLLRARELLSMQGTLYVHLDPRESHYVKVELDRIFGRESFLNELVWAYDYGGKPRRRWPPKHDTILVYVRSPGEHFFDAEAVEREPYMAPGLVSAEQRARGKRPTDTWWHTIVPTNGRERTGYPTQKPEGIVRRLLQASCPPGGRCLDFFAGSGTLGAVAQQEGRRFVLCDQSTQAIEVMVQRLGYDATA